MTYPERIWAYAGAFKMWRESYPDHATNPTPYVREDIAKAETDALAAALDEIDRLHVQAECREQSMAEQEGEIAQLSEANKRLREALTPSGETKAAYMGEFSMKLPLVDEDGDEFMREINIPWTAVKKIMAAILSRAALKGADQ